MSLFGTSPNRPDARVKNALFEDEPTTKSTKQTSSLFEDDASTPKPSNMHPSNLFTDEDNHNANDNSPWNTPVTIKRKSASDIIKTLLPTDGVPDTYNDIYDALLESGDAAGSGVSLSVVRKLVDGAGIGAEEATKILRIVNPEGASTLGRPEVNVLLALIGLSQEREEVSLDGVDERRQRLPQPILPKVRVGKPEQHSGEREEVESPAPTSKRDTSSTTARSATVRKSSFTFPDTDPWATTSHAKQNQEQTNGYQRDVTGILSQRTTSAFTTSGYDSSIGVEGHTHGSETTPGTAPNTWGVYDSTSGSTYGASRSGTGGFGESGGNDDGEPEQRPHRFAKSGGGNKTFGRPAEESVTVTALPEKEGLFLFQHRNYEVASTRRNSKVIRRYSDFVWLLDCLHKKYPFRQLPLLPPKRVAINGNHIAADVSFIEKRRRGLGRFANALVRHPVLREEQLVLMFLTVPTELSVWRKQATITVEEEFVGKTLPATLEDSLPATLEDLFETVRSGVRRSAETYIGLCSLLERLVKRKEVMASDYLRLSTTLQSLTETSEDTYKIDTNDVPMLNEGITSTARHISTSQSLLEDEAKTWDEGVLEDFKRQRDALVSMRDLFDRRDRFSKDNIPQLERRITSNENKLTAVRAKADDQRKPGEAEKLAEAITKDKESIVQQHARSIFIKECIRDEIQTFKTSQYHLSRLYNDWSQERVKYAELEAENWRALSEEVESMPMGE